MKSYDKSVIIIGLFLFLLIVAFPFLKTLGTNPVSPKVDLPKNFYECVASANYMKSSHMQLLNDWRDAVVRDGLKVWLSHTGKQYNMSLTNECLRCHSNKTKFCDQCHNYMGVVPFCWDCHTYPKEVK